MKHQDAVVKLVDGVLFACHPKKLTPIAELFPEREYPYSMPIIDQKIVIRLKKAPQFQHKKRAHMTFDMLSTDSGSKMIKVISHVYGKIKIRFVEIEKLSNLKKLPTKKTWAMIIPGAVDALEEVLKNSFHEAEAGDAYHLIKVLKEKGYIIVKK